MHRIKTMIMGAAGRDFHNFNTVYRDNELYDVVAFTATQIPNIDDRKYPASLAGKLYPKGIPIYDESAGGASGDGCARGWPAMRLHPRGARPDTRCSTG